MLGGGGQARSPKNFRVSANPDLPCDASGACNANGACERSMETDAETRGAQPEPSKKKKRPAGRAVAEQLHVDAGADEDTADDLAHQHQQQHTGPPHIPPQAGVGHC